MKQYFIYFLLCVLFGNLPSTAFGQDETPSLDYTLNHNPNDYQIATPNAASFNKYVTNPINLYSGTARFEIPLYTLKDGEITLPITLTYASTGIKVSEEASWVGLGWNLSVGGYITRRVVGKVDCTADHSYYEDVIEAYDPNLDRTVTDYAYGGWSTQMREAMDWYLTEPSARDDYNREGRFNPDVFNYSCPDGSGMFVIDWRDGNIYQLNRKQDVKIEMIVTSGTVIGQTVNASGGHLIGFKLTFPNGVIHRFELKSTMITSKPANLGVQAETYALTETTYPNGQQANYTYTSVPNISFNYTENLKSMLPSTGIRMEGDDGFSGTVEYSYSSRDLSDFTGLELILSRITTDNYQVDFSTTGREDLPDVKKLDRIQVKALATGETCYDQHFTYSYFVSASVGDYWSRYHCNFSAYRQTDHMLKRLRLDAVYNMNGNLEGEIYRFTYNPKALPRKDSYAVDYWGYYNGQSQNKSFIPDLYYLMQSHYNDYLNLRELPSEHGSQLQKALRAYDFESCQASVLTGIQYPTGGYSEIIYEPHRFTGDYIPTVTQCKDKPQNLIKGVNIYDNNSFFDPGDLYSGLPKNYKYDFARDKTVRILLTVSRGQNSWQAVSNHKAYLYYVKNGVEQRVDFSMKTECEEHYLEEEVNHTASPTTSLCKDFTVSVPAGMGWFVVDYPDELGDQSSGSGTNGRIEMYIEFENEEAPETEVESEGAGLRVKEINFYDSPSKQTLLQKTSYEYTQPGNTITSGVLLNRLQFINYYPQTYDKLGRYAGATECGFQVVHRLVRRSDKLEISGHNFFSSPYQASADVGYTWVKEIVQGNRQNGYTLYTFHNQAPITREHSIPIYDPLNGTLVESASYNASDTLLRKETFVYEAPVYHYYYGMNFYDRINLFPEIFDPHYWHCMEMDDNISEDAFYKFCESVGSVYAYMKFSQDKFENFYLGNAARLSMTVHPLNFHNILLRGKTVWEDGVERTETYTYNTETLQLKTKEINLSPEGTVRIAYTYPNDCEWGVYAKMNAAHFIEPIVEEKKIVDGMLVESVLTEYKKLTGNLFVPSAMYRSNINNGISSVTTTFSLAGRNTTVYPIPYTVYNDYDSYGHVLNLTEGEIEKTYLWSYKGQYPVAEIQNATYAAVKSALGSLTPTTLSNTALPDMSHLRSLLVALPDAHVTVYEYKIGVGISKRTHPNGENSTYEYDGLSRLKAERDHNGETVSSYEYHYK